MELNTLIILLPFAFTLHNLEEVLGMEKWTKSVPSYIHKPVTTRQFGIAVLIFSILGFVVTLTKDIYQTEKYYYFVIAGFSGMMLLNVFLPHLFATMFLRKYAPGVISGLLINLPLTTWILISLRNFRILTIEQLIISILSGGIIGVFLAFIFLKIGEQIDKKL
ncbi:MAG: HXXEE domain-containing protein [Flavobacteriales bacterium]